MYIDEIIKRQPFWGEWVIDSKIGEGSFGSVYMISRQDYTFVNKAAMKVICVPKDQKEHDRILENAGSLEGAKRYCREIRDRLLNEIKIMNQFKGNSQIVSMEDYKVEEAAEDDFGFSLLIRMELCKTVNAYIDNKQDYFANASELIRLGVSMCNALELVHSNSLLHRDIKPGNIFVSQDGNFKLGDFGMAAGRYSGEENPHAAGTYDYMAPEVCNNLGYDVRADIYSLGLTLYYFANGLRGPYLENVFTAPTRNDKNIAFSKRMKNEPMLPPSLVPKPLADIILRACAFDQNERYMTARDMKAALVSAEREIFSMNVGNQTFMSGSASYGQSYMGGSFSVQGNSVGSSSLKGSVPVAENIPVSGSVSMGSLGFAPAQGVIPGSVSGSMSVSNPPASVNRGASGVPAKEEAPVVGQANFDDKPAKKKKGLIIFLISVASFLLVASAVVLVIVFSSPEENTPPDVITTGKPGNDTRDTGNNVIGEKDKTVTPPAEKIVIEPGKTDPDDPSVDEENKDNDDPETTPEIQKKDPVLLDGSIDAYSDKGHILKGMSKDDIRIDAVFTDGEETVEGEFSLDCPEIVTESGEYTWHFKPYSNEIYNEVEGKIRIKVFYPDMIEGLEAYEAIADKSEILYLTLEEEKLTDVSFLADAVNLEKLNLDDNELTSLDGLEKCEHLRTLAFNNNASLKDVGAILGLKELTKVYADSTGVATKDLLLLEEMVKSNQKG